MSAEQELAQLRDVCRQVVAAWDAANATEKFDELIYGAFVDAGGVDALRPAVAQDEEEPIIPAAANLLAAEERLQAAFKAADCDPERVVVGDWLRRCHDLAAEVTELAEALKK